MKIGSRFKKDDKGRWWYTPPGTTRRWAAEQRECAGCGETFIARKAAAVGKYCGYSCMSGNQNLARFMHAERGPTHHNWRGGRYRNKDGYIMVLAPSHPSVQGKGSSRQYVLEHRLVMEQKLGRPLKSRENVHHLNAIRDDNRPENLELWQQSQPSGRRVSDLPHCSTCSCSNQ